MSTCHSATPLSPAETRQAAARPWEFLAWVAGVFTVLVGVLMVAGHVYSTPLDPLKSPQLKEQKEKLRQNPTDEQTKQAIRQLDLRLRQSYFSRLARTQSGAYLLLAGVAVFIFAVTRVNRIRKQPPIPAPKTDSAKKIARLASVGRWSVAASGAVLGVFLFLLSLGLGTSVPQRAEQVEKLLGGDSPTAVASDAASAEELRQNWPRFRGPDGGGVSWSTNAPTSWDPKTGAGVAWKTPVPVSGFNSPIAWGNRIFLCGGDAAKREVFCFSTSNGQQLWREPVLNVPGSPAQPPEIPDSTGYAAPTMATDGRRVYVIFANSDVAAFTLEGKLAWSRNLGPLKNPYGHAISLATWQDKLILQLDQGESEEGKSKLLALDGRTGQVAWQRPRKVGSSWASPIVVEAAGKPQVITLAIPNVISYSALDGAELWRVDCLNGEVTPSPVYAGGLVLIASPADKLVAIRPDGQGDVTKTHIAWTSDENVPDVTSPVSNGELVFTVTTSGMLTCFDAKDGKKQWEHDFETECHASPSLAGNKLYLFSQKGVAVVVEAGRQFKELFRTEMGDAFHASPAFIQDKIILRGVSNLWCVARSPEKLAKQP